MRRVLRTMTPIPVVAAFVLAVSGVSASPGSQSDERANAEFEALVTRVRQSDPSVDFLQLRRLFAESDTYTPYRDDAEDSMIDAAEAGRYETALQIARDILARNYVNIEAHLAATVACTELRDTACAAHHRYVARGLIESILASGDGKTPATAFVVVSTPEEYALLRILQKRSQGQALARSDDGHWYDRLTVLDERTNERTSIHFNVDIAIAAMRRVFGLDRLR